MHFPTIADPGLRCSCGWVMTGVKFEEAKRRWWRHATTRVWTVSDYESAWIAADRVDDFDAMSTLARHHPHVDHCGGYEVLAWPCPVVAGLLERLLPDSARMTRNPPAEVEFEESHE